MKSPKILNDDTIKFVENQSNDSLSEIYELAKDELRDVNKQLNLATIYTMLLTVVYFLLKQSEINEINVGFITFKNLDFCKMLLPSLWAFAFLYYNVYYKQQQQLITFLKVLGKKMYFQVQVTEANPLENDQIIRLTTPFSFWQGIYSKIGCVGIVFWLPFLLIPCAVIYIAKDMICLLTCEYWSYSFLGKVSTCFTIWVFIYILYYMFFSQGDIELAKKIKNKLNNNTNS